MLNLHLLKIEALAEALRISFNRSYGNWNPDYANIIGWIATLVLENIANSDTLYHDVDHTIMVAQAGQEILRGKHLLEGGVTPRDWLHFMIAVLCHDIGYVRGVCRADSGDQVATGIGDQTLTITQRGTNAALTPYHVDRSMLFIRERFAGHDLIDAERIASYIELTRFPPPEDGPQCDPGDFPALVRSADFIGQLGDPDYLRKLPALFFEFAEQGANERLGYSCPDDMRRGFATFFWNEVSPYIQNALRYLRVTQEGKHWIANLHKHVFDSEHAIKPV